GFGDILVTGHLARLLTVVEGAMGIGTTALLIGYLPTLYGAFSRREVELLMLDDLDDDIVTPVGVITSLATDRHPRGLDDWLANWRTDVQPDGRLHDRRHVVPRPSRAARDTGGRDPPIDRALLLHRRSAGR